MGPAHPPFSFSGGSDRDGGNDDDEKASSAKEREFNKMWIKSELDFLFFDNHMSCAMRGIVGPGI